MIKPWLTLAFAAALATLPAAAQQAKPGGLVSLSAATATVPDPASLTVKGATYAPAYSSLRIGSGKQTIDLAVTLSIHNASDEAPLVLERIDYYDTAGSLVERHLAKPIAIRPFGTIEVFVPKEDVRGGTGANFFIAWAATGPIPEPVIETVAVGAVGNNAYSIVSQGRTIRSSGLK